MAISNHIKMIYDSRRKNIKKYLRHGDVRRLAEKLINAFPDITKSEPREYAGYLSQVFNAKSTRPFSDSLTRCIEDVWDELKPGDLDNTTSEQDIEHEYLEQGRQVEQKNDLNVGYKKDSVLPAIFLDALQWRIHQKYPNTQILTNEILRLQSGDYVADLVVKNDIGSPPILIVETGTNIGALKRVKKISHLDFLLSESEAPRGLLAILDNGEIVENWLQNKNL